MPNQPQSAALENAGIGLQNLYSAVRSRPAPPSSSVTEITANTANCSQPVDVTDGPVSPSFPESESANGGRSRPSPSDKISDNGSDKIGEPAPPYLPSPERIRWYTQVHRNAEKNARVRGIPFRLSLGDFHLIVDRSRGCCEVSGIRFSRSETGKHARNPWAPSLDRIESHLGYTPDNCRLVCVAANLGMNTWGLGTLVKLSRAIVSQHGMRGQSPEMQRMSRLKSKRTAAETRRWWAEQMAGSPKGGS
jgi:hypothetical protein